MYDCLFPGTIASLILAAMETSVSDDGIMTRCQLALISCATPLAILKSATLRKVNQEYFEDTNTGDVLRAQQYSSLFEFLEQRFSALVATARPDTMMRLGGWETSFSLLMTRSPSGHLDLNRAAYNCMVLNILT